MTAFDVARIDPRSMFVMTSGIVPPEAEPTDDEIQSLRGFVDAAIAAVGFDATVTYVRMSPKLSAKGQRILLALCGAAVVKGVA